MGTMFSLNGFRGYFVINLNQVIPNSEIMLQKWQIGPKERILRRIKFNFIVFRSQMENNGPELQTLLFILLKNLYW